MKLNRLLAIASVFSVLLFTLHMADDIVRGIEKGDLGNLGAFPIGALWLYGALVLNQRRSGYVLMLLGALLGMVISIVHMRGRGIGAADPEGLFLFAWTLMTLGVTSLFSLGLLAGRAWAQWQGRAASGRPR